MHRTAFWLTIVAGSLLMLFGLGCLNYTKVGSLERHREVAARNGWPPPSRPIAYTGMLLAPLGAGLVGFALGRWTGRGERES